MPRPLGVAHKLRLLLLAHLGLHRLPHGCLCLPGPRLPLPPDDVGHDGPGYGAVLPGGLLREDDADGHCRHRPDPRGHGPDVPAGLHHGHGAASAGAARPGRGPSGRLPAAEAWRTHAGGQARGPQRGALRHGLHEAAAEVSWGPSRAKGPPGALGLGRGPRRGSGQGAPLLPAALARGLLPRPRAPRAAPALGPRLPGAAAARERRPLHGHPRGPARARRRPQRAAGRPAHQ
mmetsp:Transcript_24844/g.77410  ORF Transcript_24844/g.77410 Transcript_24844/m.77410 type:complete len:233 (-) Transcript_24844:351-1049(-)